MYSNQNEYEQNMNQDLYHQEKEEEIKAEIDVNIRLGFIRKVYGILTFQLLFTSIFCLCCITSESLKKFLISNVPLFDILLILEIIVSFTIICCKGISRKVPLNYILLFIFTFAESYIVGFICAFTNPKVVFMAATMTFIIVIFLTIYAITTKTDISMQGSLMFIFSAGLLCLVIFNFFFRFKLLHVIICCGCVVIFGFYIVYDTQLIIGNKSEMIQVDDYILASYMIYTDIIGLFLQLLSLFNSSD